MRDFQRAGRSLAMGREGMVATSHPDSTLAGVEILKAGGNAIDAAIAACAVQCVVEPQSTGVGGECFVLLARDGGDEVIAYNGSGRSPALADLDWFLRRGISRIEWNSPHAVMVPGAVEAWGALWRKHGRLPWERLFDTAVKRAIEGYVITPRVAYDWEKKAPALAEDTHAARIFLPHGRPMRAGEVHRQPELGATLAAITANGPDGFYHGPIADDVVARLQELGGLHTAEDFRVVAGEFVSPISTSYCGYKFHVCPPNGQGIAALVMLNILAGIDLPADALSADRLHYEIEAGRLGYALRDAAVADPSRAHVPVEEILSAELANQLRTRIDLGRAIPGVPEIEVPRHKDTVYLCVVDRDRNAVSFNNSLFESFGSTIVAPRSGILLNNRGKGFVVRKDHPNCVAGSKRPMNTLMPGLVTRGGRVQMPFGVMGGHYQAMGQAAFLTRVLRDGADIQSAMDMPRFAPVPGTAEVEVELPMPATSIAALRDRHFEIVQTPRPIGGAQAIWIDWEQGTLIGASDHRKDGLALGY